MQKKIFLESFSPPNCTNKTHTNNSETINKE